MTWIYNKIKSTGCVQFLLDVYLTIPYSKNHQQQSPISKLSGHLEFLLKFLQIYFKPLNYDAQQIYSLLSTHINHEIQDKNDNVNNQIIQNWLKSILDQNLLTIQKIKIDDDDNSEENEDESDGNENGYDQLINTNSKDENFIISVHTDREEICVWNVLK